MLEMNSLQTADHHAVIYKVLFPFKTLSLKLWAGYLRCDGESVSLCSTIAFKGRRGAARCACVCTGGLLRSRPSEPKPTVP